MNEKINRRQISDKAVFLMSIYAEEYIKNVTEKGLEFLEEMNRKREIQGLRKQVRFDEKCILEGVTIINQENILNTPEKQVGGKRKEENKNTQHGQINEILTEVV